MSANQFRIPVEALEEWRKALEPHRSVRAVDDVAKDVARIAGYAGSDGHAIVGRHQLFSWTQSLEGASGKLPLGGAEDVRIVARDMQAYLGGRAPTPPPAAASSAPAAGAYAAPPPVVYQKAPAGAASGMTRLVGERELPDVIRRMLRDAREELLVISPWKTGLETLVGDLHGVAPSVRLRFLTRRPEPDDPAYHRALHEWRRRGADLVASPNLHTRMIVQDGAAVLVGSATLGAAWAKELAVLSHDASLVAQARAEFGRLQEEARRS